MSTLREGGRLNAWQRIVEPNEEIPAADLTKLFHDLLDHLGFCVVVEETPDYTSYSIEKKITG